MTDGLACAPSEAWKVLSCKCHPSILTLTAVLLHYVVVMAHPFAIFYLTVFYSFTTEHTKLHFPIQLSRNVIASSTVFVNTDRASCTNRAFAMRFELYQPDRSPVRRRARQGTTLQVTEETLAIISLRLGSIVHRSEVRNYR